MPYRLQPVTASTITHAPPPCVGCVFWQSSARRTAPKGKWAERASASERFLVPRTIFPSDFLSDFGFYPVRWEGNVALARLELGGLQPVVEGKRARVLAKVKEAFVPAPVPERPA